jgi:hypothetical protein
MNNFELIVLERKDGILKTNLAELEKFVLERLEEYTPDKFIGDADAAKVKRSELNNAKKQISAERIKLGKELMKPFDAFMAKCKGLEKLIDDASGQLDEIVKAKEAAEAEIKRAEIEAIWQAQNFGLIPLEQVWNKKWLNKGEKLSDIEFIIKKVLDEIKVIEALPEGQAEIKAFYLETLDLSGAMTRHKAFMEQKARAEAEQKAREEAEKPVPIPEIEPEFAEKPQKQEEFLSVSLKITGTAEQLRELRAWIDANELIYEKI